MFYLLSWYFVLNENFPLRVCSLDAGRLEQMGLDVGLEL